MKALVLFLALTVSFTAFAGGSKIKCNNAASVASLDADTNPSATKTGNKKKQRK